MFEETRLPEWAVLFHRIHRFHLQVLLIQSPRLHFLQFELSIYFIPYTLCYSSLLLENCSHSPNYRLPTISERTSPFLWMKPWWLYHSPFRSPLTSLPITQSWRNHRVNLEKKFFFSRSSSPGFKGFFFLSPLSSVYSSRRKYCLLSFTPLNTILLF